MAASISFQQAVTQSGSSGSYSLAFTSVASAAGQERLVALLGIVSTPNAGTATFTSVTVDGQTATQVGSYVRTIDDVANAAMVSFWRAAGTSATSVAVAFNIGGSSGGMFDARGALWSLNDAGSLLDTATSSIQLPAAGSGPGDASLDIDTAAGGVVAAVVLSYSSTTHSSSWSGLTEQFDGGTLYTNDWYTVADLNAGSASTPLSVTATHGATFFANSAVSGLAVSFNPAATGTTLTAAAGSYAETGASAGLAWGQVNPAGSYALTGSAAGFVVAVGNVVLTAGAGSYNLSGSTAAFPGYEAQPSTGGGYTGGASRGRMIRKYAKRKREDEDEPLAVAQPAAQPFPKIPQPPPLPPQPGLMAGVPIPPITVLRSPKIENDDDEAIALLLEILS